MAKITIEINTDNAAFEDPFEVVRILQDLATKADNHGSDYLADLKIRDINGNVVGVCAVEEENKGFEAMAYHEGDYTECQNCHSKITWQEYAEQTGLCSDCVESIN